MGPIIDLVFGPDRGSPALYYTVWKNKLWYVRKIAYVPPDGREIADSHAAANIGTSLLLLGLCGAPYLRRRLRTR